jgi:trigger factor
MNITVESQPNCRAVLRIDVPSADVVRERERVTDKYARHARLPGFREGKAPRAVVAKRFEPQIREELEEALVRLGYGEASKREDVEILSVLGVKEQSLHPDESFSFALEVNTVPHFELPEYKDIPVKLPHIEVTDADVDHDLLHLRERFKTYTDVERGAQIGDYTVINATGSLDGQPMDEAMPDAPAFVKKIDGNWFQLSAKEDFLPGFYAELTGIRKDESRDVSIPLGDDFPYEPLRGKTIVLQVTCTAVKEAHLPEVDDEFAKKVHAEWDLARLKEEVRKAITHRREQSNDESKTSQVISHLAEKLEFELPQDVVNREAQRRTNDIAMNAMRQGMDQDAIMQAQEQIVSAATQQARQNVKVSFILGEVARKEKITVAEDQIRHSLARMAAQQNKSPKKFMVEAQKSNLIERLREDLLLENALNFLKENARVEETEPVKDDCGHDHGDEHEHEHEH